MAKQPPLCAANDAANYNDADDVTMLHALG